MSQITPEIQAVFDKVKTDIKEVHLDDVLVLLKVLKNEVELNSICKNKNKFNADGSKVVIDSLEDFDHAITARDTVELLNAIQNLSESSTIFIDNIVNTVYEEERVVGFYIPHFALKKLKAEGIEPVVRFGQLDNHPTIPAEHRRECFVKLTLEFENFFLEM